MRKPERKGTKVPVMTAKEAVTYIKDNDKSYVSVRKYAEPKKRYIAAKKKIAAM